MPGLGDRSHLSIGEVLSLLQDEFPDITISKIRFLESQGLLDPERTPSGYRKFYAGDIERLRFILTQQKDHFLPLRVIKDRLEVPGEPLGNGDERPVESEPAGADPGYRSMAPGATGAGHVEPTSRGTLDAGPSGVSLTRDELLSASGLESRDLDDLERFGLTRGRPMGRETVYDEEALVVARVAAGFRRFGVEARHLRMYKVAAEREAGFFEQVVMPLVKQRNPTARRQAVERLEELTMLGDQLHAAMLRISLRRFQA